MKQHQSSLALDVFKQINQPAPPWRGFHLASDIKISVTPVRLAGAGCWKSFTDAPRCLTTASIKFLRGEQGSDLRESDSYQQVHQRRFNLGNKDDTEALFSRLPVEASEPDLAVLSAALIEEETLTARCS